MAQTYFEYSLIAISESISFQIALPEDNQDLVLHFKLAMASEIDYENKTAKVENPIRNSPELREKVNLLVEHYKAALPQIHRLSKYFNKELTEAEYFFLIPTIEITTEYRLFLSNHLKALNEGIDFEIINKQFNDIFEDLLKEYSMFGFDERCKKSIGERDKAKRICRFCGKGQPEVSFKKIAHSISEALGNKKIISNEECDSCNEKFGSGIETDFIAYLDLYRSFFRIRGKQGPPKLKGKNFEFSTTETTVEIQYFIDAEEKEEGEMGFSRRLETHSEIADQNIYKTLCKYFIGVIDSRYVPKFWQTIQWINGEREIVALPKVAIMCSYHFFKTTHPSICVYLRKNANETLPYAVGEFHCTFLTFTFIIPMESSDEKNFLNVEDYKRYWDFFRHYSLNKDWKFKDLSNPKKKPLVLNVNFNARKQS